MIVPGDRYEIVMKNCVNYGTISSNGNTEGGAWIGGVIGVCSWVEYPKMIQNCLNYGTIESAELQTDTLQIGILGVSMKVALSNCMSGGKIGTGTDSGVGKLVGFLYSSTNITNSRWTNESWNGDSYGTGNPGATLTETNSFKVTSPIEALDDLNSFVTSSNKWSK